MTPEDKLYIFQCGHAEWNPSVGNRKHHKCLRCGRRQKVRYIIRICTRCNQKVLLLKPIRAKAELCPECRVIQNRERANTWKQRNPKAVKSYRKNKSQLDESDYYCTLEEIGQFFGITREWARQIEDRALRKFRRNWKIMYPKEPNPLDGFIQTTSPQSRYMKGHVR